MDSASKPGTGLFELIGKQKRVLAAHRHGEDLVVEVEIWRAGRPFPVPFVLAYDHCGQLRRAHAGAFAVTVTDNGYLILAKGQVIRAGSAFSGAPVELSAARGVHSYAAGGGRIVAAAWADPHAVTLEDDAAAYAAWQQSGELATFAEGRPDNAVLRLVVDGALSKLGLELTGRLAVTPDGLRGAAGLVRNLPNGHRRYGMYLFPLDSVESGHEVWPEVDLMTAVPSPNGTWFACASERVSHPGLAPHQGVFLLSADGTRSHDLTAVHDDWLEPQAWLGTDVLCVGALGGRRRLWRMSASTGALTPMEVAGSVASVTAAGDGVLVVRSAIDCPPEVVSLATRAASPADGTVALGDGTVPLDPGPALHGGTVSLDRRAGCPTEAVVYAPAAVARPAGQLERQVWHDETGQPWHAWLCLPDGANEGPLPVLVWCHGGPMLSWTEWSWRWNPWPFVVDGYAVLMIDPPLSIGYGRETVARGWGRWLTEVARVAAGQVRGIVERDPRLDGMRLGTMGASFGGWLSIALATLLPDVQLVVAHAGWVDLAGVARTCDLHWHWLREYGPVEGNPAYAREMARLSDVDPACRVLLSHGCRDEHVPYYEAFGVQRSLRARGVDVRLMLLPDEGHSIRRPANAAAWFDWVARSCAERLRGR